MWKGILLAGGMGTRLAPLTNVVNKHLLPVYDKPMIYYPLTTLMMCGVRDIVVVSTPSSLHQIEGLLKDGSQWGIEIVYVEQSQPRGIADSFLCAQEQISGYKTALILGDNIFYGSGLPSRLRQAMDIRDGATILGYEVADPSSLGVVELNSEHEPVSIEEKPTHPKSNLAIPGLYFYDEQVLGMAQDLQPSSRGELEITDINRCYLVQDQLRVLRLGRGTAWLDGGTHNDLFEASQFIKVLEERTGLKIACPEEVALREGFVNRQRIKEVVEKLPKNGYREYLEQIIQYA